MMYKAHNFGTVFRFEVVRVLKKPAFWAMVLGFPLLIGLIVGIVVWSNQATNEAVAKLQEQSFSIALTDESGLIRPEIADALKVQTLPDEAVGVERVKQHQVDAYIYVPRAIETEAVRVYGKDEGIFQNGKYEAVATALLSRSVDGKLTPAEAKILKDSVATTLKTYKDGHESGGINEMIVPGFFLVLFYMLIAFFGNQMLMSTVEEKENRTVEMLFTTVQAQTLIVGKICALVVLSIIQGLVIVLPMLVAYFGFGSQLQLPNFDLSQIVFDPGRIAISVLLFASSFMMLTGLLVMLGAMMPTAKEASTWVGLVMMLLFGPLYGASVFVSYPESTFSLAMSFFPLTAPIPLMIRNTVGNLQPHEAVLAVVILTVSAALTVAAAVRLFRYGAMQYDSRLSLAALRSRRRDIA